MLTYFDDWSFCVSIATSYLSSSWEEFFFAFREEAKKFYDKKKTAGYAVLMVDRNSY